MVDQINITNKYFVPDVKRKIVITTFNQNKLVGK